MIKRSMRALCLSLILSASALVFPFLAQAQRVEAHLPVAHGPLTQVNKYFSTQTTTYSDGAVLARGVINGPPAPPPGFESERDAALLTEPYAGSGVVNLSAPAFRWVFGCSAVSAAMIAGYYDRNGYSHMYTGASNKGVMPLVEDASWGTWTDSLNDEYPGNPLIASQNGVDGREIPGSIDDYWVSYGSSASDPYITGGWTQHAWGDAVGDYMKTSQSAYGRTDGSTSFAYYPNSPSRLTCSAMELYSGLAQGDGTYGRKLFYEARGYEVTDCYYQLTDNNVSGGFSFEQYKAEIDAGHPVLLSLVGHSIVGVGYDDAAGKIYIHDTWDNSDHIMDWGGSYSGLALRAVSIVKLGALKPNRMLWTNASTGKAALWRVDEDDDKYSQSSYGPYSGWMPLSYHRNSDGTGNILWDRASDGYAALWSLDSSDVRVSMKYYGPFAGWRAVNFHRKADGAGRMLWYSPSDGRAVLWTLDASNVKVSQKSLGAFRGWKPLSYHENQDGTARILWVRESDGYAVLWTLDASDVKLSQKNYGSFSGWLPTSYHQNDDGSGRLLWTSASLGKAALWTLNSSDGKVSQEAYGPFSGWTAQSYD